MDGSSALPRHEEHLAENGMATDASETHLVSEIQDHLVTRTKDPEAMAAIIENERPQFQEPDFQTNSGRTASADGAEPAAHRIRLLESQVALLRTLLHTQIHLAM